MQTGKTLVKRLVEVEDMPITSKLVCNRASLKTKPKRVKDLVDRLSRAVAEAKSNRGSGAGASLTGLWGVKK
jgi:ATP phosphoribosyltransferase